VTVSVAVWLTDAYVAVIVAVPLAPTTAVAVNPAELCPCGTTTVAGLTVAMAVFELETATELPPVGAMPVRPTVPAEDAPPIRLEGDSETDASAAGTIVSVAVFETAEYVAVIVTFVFAVTADVLTGNVTVAAPDGTVTVPPVGTVAAAVFELETVTTAPPVGANPFSVKVAVDTLPPARLDGASTREVSAALVTVCVAVFETLA
jgi:hypothetical protein